MEERTDTSNITNSNNEPISIPLDPRTGGKTVLDSGSEGEAPISWGAMSSTAGILQMSDENDSEVSANSSPGKTPRTKRSPNRDDSDSEDEDENGNKLEKKPEDSETSATFDPATDAEFLKSGLKAGFAEDRNKRFRRTMEDAHSILIDYNNAIGSGFFAVFDGHAGRAAADYCGEALQKIFANLLTSNPNESPASIFHKTFLQIDSELAKKKGLHSGCTAAVAFIQTEIRDGQKKRILYTANVGDARTVLARAGTAVRLSYDHKGSDPAESRRIVESGGFMMNNRVNGVLAVTRSLGDLSMKEWVIGAPYTTETILEETDTTLIVACDGIWDVCPDQDAVNLIKDIKDPQEAADRLVDFSLDNRSTDNLTAIVVSLRPDYT